MPQSTNRSWLLVLSDAVYRRLLVCYPKSFRAAYGAEMAQVFRDRARDVYRGHGVGGLLALWVAALRDLVSAAVAERLVEERQMARKVATLATGLLVLGTILVTIVQGYSLLQGIAVVFDGVVNRPVFNLLIVVYGLVHSFPLALVLVTLVYQLCLLPLTYELLRDARALRTIQPELRHLREEYRDDPAAWQAARRNLYRTHDITTGGVPLWLVLQIIFLYALYGAFLTVLPRSANLAVEPRLADINFKLYPFVPHVQALPELGFLWTNLGAADPLYVLPVLAVLLTALVVYLLMRHRSMLLAAAVLALFIVSGPVGPVGLALSWGVSMLVTVAGYIALSRHVAWTSDPAPRS